ncbi:LbetaH domain-containing protein [Methanococcus aeolicus]|uniref:carbonic anhydrase n=1 Tax=Methanococcus aeolicus TaxID=42879 RepID=UPI0012F701BC|nr:carbonic anhydrase [Methanococcus aeolicus]UXM85340.1 carbonic anhydrase [Methanococcus aeolicus]
MNKKIGVLGMFCVALTLLFAGCVDNQTVDESTTDELKSEISKLNGEINKLKSSPNMVPNIRKNLEGHYPSISKTGTYIDPNAVVIGNVKIGDDVYVGPHALIRCDEIPTEGIIIGNKVNIQDGVIIHALRGTKIEIEDEASLAHGCIVHGPAKIDKNAFIAFGAVVFAAEIGQGALIGHNAVVDGIGVEGGLKIPAGKLVPSGTVVMKDIDGQVKAFLPDGTVLTDLNDLPEVVDWYKAVPKKVVDVNIELAEGYLNMQDLY